MADFSTDVSAWATKMGARADMFVQVLAFEAVNRVKELTPVRTGFLRANWSVIKKGDATPKASAEAIRNSQGVDKAKAAKEVERIKAGDVVTIINPTVYARRIEYGFVGADSGGHHYHQGGRHMMTQTVTELPAMARELLTRLGG